MFVLIAKTNEEILSHPSIRETQEERGITPGKEYIGLETDISVVDGDAFVWIVDDTKHFRNVFLKRFAHTIPESVIAERAAL